MLLLFNIHTVFIPDAPLISPLQFLPLSTVYLCLVEVARVGLGKGQFHMVSSDTRMSWGFQKSEEPDFPVCWEIFADETCAVDAGQIGSMDSCCSRHVLTRPTTHRSRNINPFEQTKFFCSSLGLYWTCAHSGLWFLFTTDRSGAVVRSASGFAVFDLPTELLLAGCFLFSTPLWVYFRACCA